MSPARFDSLLVTCEHASNHVPPEFASAFEDDRVLNTHRAWDAGALVLARELEDAFHAPGFHGEFTRLLVDLNRREKAPNLFSEFTPGWARGRLLEWHRRWRTSVLKEATRACERGVLLHVSVHSFTPVLDDRHRDVDIGLLYDPARRLEREAAATLRAGLAGLRVRRNYPYRGVSDGVATWLRRELPLNRYAGLEIELNQAFSEAPPADWADIRDRFISALAELLPPG